MAHDEEDGRIASALLKLIRAIETGRPVRLLEVCRTGDSGNPQVLPGTYKICSLEFRESEGHFLHLGRPGSALNDIGVPRFKDHTELLRCVKAV